MKVQIIAVTVAAAALAGCITTGSSSPGVGGDNTQASAIANERADKLKYKPVDYRYKDVRGPTIVVIPGQIKSTNATFSQKVTANNIADYAELELGNANFRVLERADLGPLLNEVQLAVGTGDPSALRKFRRGKFKTTKWFMKFDILKAEPVAEASTGFSGGALSGIISTLGGYGTGTQITSQTVRSTQLGNEAGVWIIGMRYKVIDASTSEQVATGYYEEKMEMGAKGVSVLGVSTSGSGRATLDTLAQLLVQMSVADIDAMKPGKGSAGSASKSSDRGGLSRSVVKQMQSFLASLGYDVGAPDGLPGRKTRAALSQFQSDNGLNVTGDFNPATMKKIRELAGQPG